MNYELRQGLNMTTWKEKSKEKNQFEIQQILVHNKLQKLSFFNSNNVHFPRSISSYEQVKNDGCWEHPAKQPFISCKIALIVSSYI